MSDEMAGAATCREAVDLVVERIQSACDDVGGGQGAFITEEDVVRCVTHWPRLASGWVLTSIFFQKSCRGSTDNERVCEDGVWC